MLPQEPISVDDIIERRRQRKLTGKRKRDSDDESDETEEESEGGDSEDDDESEEDADEEESEGEMMGPEDSETVNDPLATSDEEEDIEKAEADSVEEDEEPVSDADESDDGSEEETQAEKDRKTAFFASDAGPVEEHSSFMTMNLSRPVLKAITSLSFTKPTPIQAATIPVALLGKDIVGNAVTGSGKTAAFIVPMIERLMYRERGKKAAATRCLVLVPTRELGVQCYEVGTKLATHTDIRFCLVVGTSSFAFAICSLTVP